MYCGDLLLPLNHQENRVLVCCWSTRELCMKHCTKLSKCFYFTSCYMLLLLLSRFSRVWLCATPETAAHQVPPFLGFSRQEHWSGLSFPSPKHESESEVAHLCPTLSDPMDYSLPGSSIHGIFQARVLNGVPLPSPLGILEKEKETFSFQLPIFSVWGPRN